eukprot:GEMP01079959.1.p1 GENE.GEMP01079959.1~~GEMP01079959.1.p1  ORF type:complete len:300 (+),score=20.90 GEMP01079959.1:57-902(+)
MSRGVRTVNTSLGVKFREWLARYLGLTNMCPQRLSVIYHTYFQTGRSPFVSRFDFIDALRKIDRTTWSKPLAHELFAYLTESQGKSALLTLEKFLERLPHAYYFIEPAGKVLVELPDVLKLQRLWRPLQGVPVGSYFLGQGANLNFTLTRSGGLLVFQGPHEKTGTTFSLMKSVESDSLHMTPLRQQQLLDKFRFWAYLSFGFDNLSRLERDFIFRHFDDRRKGELSLVDFRYRLQNPPVVQHAEYPYYRISWSHTDISAFFRVRFTSPFFCAYNCINGSV